MSHAPVTLFGLFSLSQLSRHVQFTVCVSILLVAFLAHDFLQELLFTQFSYNYGIGLTLFDCLGCSIFPWLINFWSTRNKTTQNENSSMELSKITVIDTSSTVITDTTPVRRTSAVALLYYFLLASLVVGSTNLSISSLSYVSFPIKVIMRCTKLIPTMVLGVVFFKKTYQLKHYIAACCMCASVIIFTLADASMSASKKNNSFSLFGIGMLALSVVCDSIAPNVQEVLIAKEGKSDRVMMITNLCTIPIIVLIALFKGELQGVLYPLYSLQFDLTVSLLVYGTTSWAGVACYMALIKSFGPAMAVSVGTARKIVTIGLSIFVLSKPFSGYYLLSLGFLITSIAITAKKK